MTYKDFKQIQKGEFIVFKKKELVVTEVKENSIIVAKIGDPPEFFELTKQQSRWVSRLVKEDTYPVVVKTLKGTTREYILESEDYQIIINYNQSSLGWISEIKVEFVMKKFQKQEESNFYERNGYLMQSLITFGPPRPPPPPKMDYTRLQMIFPNIEYFMVFLESVVVFSNHIIKEDPRLNVRKYFGDLIADLNKNLLKNP